jgi:hypothetical protein|tara:strand:+ start:2675 stop:3388 length:714 start_codon:yes stop_codon:yes gene_type:complete
MKKRLVRDKKGEFNIKIAGILFILILIIIPLVLYFFIVAPSESNQNPLITNIAKQTNEFIDNPKEKVSMWIENSPDFLENVLGFNQNFYDFIPDLLMGLLMGLFIWLSYLFIGWTTVLSFLTPKLPGSVKNQAKFDMRKLKRGWLSFIGGHPWKIIPIGVAYAVLMQVPLLNTFIRTITFEPLGVSWFFRAIILAFYLGLLPGAIEAYSRYKLRMKYYKKIMEVKEGVKIARSMSSA